MVQKPLAGTATLARPLHIASLSATLPRHASTPQQVFSDQVLFVIIFHIPWRVQAERAIRELNGQKFDDGSGGQRTLMVSRARARRTMTPGGPAPFSRSPGGYQVSSLFPVRLYKTAERGDPVMADRSLLQGRVHLLGGPHSVPIVCIDMLASILPVKFCYIMI